MTRLHELAKLGQAVWYDNIRRRLLDSGGLQALIKAGVRGVTSNPSIFEKAIVGSDDYDSALNDLMGADLSAVEIYESLAFDDIRRTADLLSPVYEQSGRLDGYVSLEVSPKLAHDTEGTIVDARRLFAALDRPNVMIKVPATPAGIPAVETLIGESININVTLIFSLDQYRAVIGAYIVGLEKLMASGGDASQVASVASFFVSRIDTAVDRHLDSVQSSAANAQALKGKIAIASAKVAYGLFEEISAGKRWASLVAQGARVQRPLWASTSTKNPAYPDTIYVDTLIGPNTVNTMPPVTLDAFQDHGTVALTLKEDVEGAQEQLARLADLGVDLERITQKLQDDGVAAFARSFDSLLNSVGEKRERLRNG
jgi:transaldolase